MYSSDYAVLVVNLFSRTEEYSIESMFTFLDPVVVGESLFIVQLILEKLEWQGILPVLQPVAI
ncbi:hypothetical protein A3I46_00550 [Candidatus Kaiserbacteria bacterium RIFCSPLOWO2_02_FULL_54_13]|uniref:Uncharacterized protein n=1 Tax=Candidatus Kaiserbacteria bacterium RIFCSPHIGHO2_02_FULL_54_22 TaxID=1798495 RepID=A0A1F6DJL1_9BACT|nr:MAG: hypothetical protein UY89_C0029G0013 [Parcubacteria group bacterium GW2011_GWA1_54_9]OGG61593.1 MAG: hypothetical protein A3C19_01015 [Candidatus Kaiserbacteria bacterium RIFCSPHIGHO2_02_FULL_54_22]OGG68962.1 MAG: hypothetical protein A3E99_03550 [Candidatus Kaiserbacteria bacterium RIFCSPHIGHO2_12_FULL_54_16]OGG82483.1 MAG: hypothetical protein A3I46_00550 [Candidatus Kaiserbacteria bacterium RIFCSPLOWO2_02_FULL_54_13]OGG90652.1 MAG: hypothetical protein A3G12_01450 [Candidatus Kaiserb